MRPKIWDVFKSIEMSKYDYFLCTHFICVCINMCMCVCVCLEEVYLSLSLYLSIYLSLYISIVIIWIVFLIYFMSLHCSSSYYKGLQCFPNKKINLLDLKTIETGFIILFWIFAGRSRRSLDVSMLSLHMYTRVRLYFNSCQKILSNESALNVSQKLGKTSSASFERLKYVYDAMSCVRVFDWHRCIKERIYVVHSINFQTFFTGI